MTTFIFVKVLKEVIEQRTKIVEEAVAANSIKLQNRIRELERENRELQWNARKLFGAFRQFIIENEKVGRLDVIYVFISNVAVFTLLSYNGINNSITTVLLPNLISQ